MPDFASIVLEEIKSLRQDVAVIKEQVIRTNGRVTNNEKEIAGIKEATLKYAVHMTNEETAAAILEKDRQNKQWFADHIQRWGPVIVSVVLAAAALLA